MPTTASRMSESTTQMSVSASDTTRGASSRHCASILDVHRSGGSITCESDE
jgi:hypothetical protein